LAVILLEFSKTAEMKKHDKTSLRNFTWENSAERTADQLLVEKTVKEWYSAKHPLSSKAEITYINSLGVSFCPVCQNTHFIKNGKRKDGIQKYHCLDCGFNFNPLTNTIFDSRKIPISEWIEYLLHLFEFHSIKSSAFDNRNASSTGKYWLIKVFEVLKGIQDDVVLEGDIWLDETYLKVIRSKTKTINGKVLRGISRNKIGIACAKDSSGKSIFILTGTSKPSRKSTLKAYGNHIKPGSKIIHDGDNSHSILVETLNLESEEHPTAETKGLKDKDNPLEPINTLHSYLKRFFREHNGYNRDELQDWLNLLWFILNDPSNKYDKVLEFIRIAISSPKRVRYRDVMSKNDDDYQY